MFRKCGLGLIKTNSTFYVPDTKENILSKWNTSPNIVSFFQSARLLKHFQWNYSFFFNNPLNPIIEKIRNFVENVLINEGFEKKTVILTCISFWQYVSSSLYETITILKD